MTGRTGVRPSLFNGGTPSLLQPFFILFLQRADIRLQLFHDIARDDSAIRM